MNEEELPGQSVGRVREYFVETLVERAGQSLAQIAHFELHRAAWRVSADAGKQQRIGIENHDSAARPGRSQGEAEQVVVTQNKDVRRAAAQYIQAAQDRGDGGRALVKIGTNAMGWIGSYSP